MAGSSYHVQAENHRPSAEISEKTRALLTLDRRSDSQNNQAVQLAGVSTSESHAAPGASSGGRSRKALCSWCDAETETESLFSSRKF